MMINDLSADEMKILRFDNNGHSCSDYKVEYFFYLNK